MRDEELNKIAPRLPQQRLARPKAEKLDFELYGVAVSSINGCELCVRVRMHADAVVKGGLSKEELAESVRIAAILHAAAITLALR